MYGFSWYLLELFLFIIGNHRLLLRDFFNNDGILCVNPKYGCLTIYVVLQMKPLVHIAEKKSLDGSEYMFFARNYGLIGCSISFLFYL